jgi:hypothetical protein
VSAEELAAAGRALAELGEQPLPPGVATRLEARLEAELTPSPLSEARRRRVRLGASLSAVAAVAAAVVFALSTTGGGPGQEPANGLRDTAATATSRSAADSAAPATMEMKAPAKAASKACPPASRTAGDRPRPGCPGARGGHARAV